MPTADQYGPRWSQDQIRNAAIIYRVGKQMGATNRDIQIALITAMVESNLVNVNYGDRDSLGLFQQRPSQGWGTPEQVLNPTHAAQSFYAALFSLGGRREQMGMGEAAQAVQRSAFPERYAERIGQMRNLWPRIARAGGEQVKDVDGKPYGVPDPITGEPEPEQKDVIPDGMVASPAMDMLDTFLGNTGEVDTDLPLPEISPATNDSLIKSMALESGPYEKGMDGWRKAVVENARSFLGTPYVWGGEGPGGFDCSGLIQYVFGQVGINLPRVSYQQAAAGQQVGLKALRPGDLVGWDNSSRNNGADHIAIYIGNGQIIEAPRPGLSVRIRSLDSNEGAFGVRLNGTQA